MNNSSIFQNITSSITQQANILDIIMARTFLIYPMPLCVIGTIGNILIILIYTKSKQLNKISTSFYICVQALVDPFAIYLGTIRYFTQAIYGVPAKDSSEFLCKFLTFAISVANCFSAWILVVTSIDRLIFILNYNNLKTLTKRRYQIIISISLFLFILASDIADFFWFIYKYEVSLNRMKCKEILLIYNQLKYVIYETTFAVLLPFTALLISSTMLIVNIRRKNALAYKLNSNDENNISTDQKSSKNHSNKKNQFSYTILKLNIYFLSFNLPACAINSIRVYTITSVIDFIYMLTTILRYSYYSFNFFTHFITNNLFREYVYSVLKKEDSLNLQISSKISLKTTNV